MNFHILGVQSHLLHNDFKAALEHIRPCLFFFFKGRKERRGKMEHVEWSVSLL